jgi:hypothetical protein
MFILMKVLNKLYVTDQVTLWDRHELDTLAMDLVHKAEGGDN